MTLTLRSASTTTATTKGSALTHAEMDANWLHLAQSSGVEFLQSGSGASAETVQDEIRRLCLTPMQFGGTMDGTTSDQTAWNATITAAAAQGKPIYIPAGDLVLTDTPTAIAGQVTIYGAGPFKSRIIFRPTAANKAAIKISNGASRAEEVICRGFAIYSDDTTYTKIAIDGYDQSFCKFEDVLIYGSGGSGPSAGACWSGNSSTSIGVRTHGRETTIVRGLKIVADRPVVIAANPNTAATDGEDSDHWHFEDLYLVGNGNPLIEVDAGLGCMELTINKVAGVAGTGFFKINDTRAAPTITSRGIKFSNIRYEQCTSASAYAFDCTFTDPVQQIAFDNVLMATGSNGIKLDGFLRATLKNVTGAMTSTQLLVANAASKSVLSLQGCIWQSGGTFTTTGLSLISAPAYRSADYAAPSDAVYAGQIVDTSFNVASGTITCANAAVGLTVTGTTGDRLEVVPQAAGSGVSIRASNNAGSDFEPLSTTAETHERRYRTGAGTSAVADQIDTSGQVSVAKRFFPAQDDGTIQSAAGLYAGTGAPNNANGSNGDFYLRGDGTAGANTVIYHKEAGSWVALTTT